MRSIRHSLSRTLVAALAFAGLAACSRTAAPPTSAELKRLAALDSARYVGKEQCLNQFRWPVTTTVQADGTPTWYVYHNELSALVAAGLAERSVRQERVTVDAGQTVTEPRLYFELTRKGAPLAQVHQDVDTDGERTTLLCFGKLAWDGNVKPESIRVEKDSVAGLIFHSSEYDEYPAYRVPDGDTIASRLSYTVQFSPSAYTEAHRAEWAAFVDNAYHIRKVYVDVVKVPAGAKSSNAGKGWVVAGSYPSKGE
ncbi:hypothetical protein [Paraburkholderia sp. J8-2]|uniref:hypothetical protein n=1 Tax=Paraburkholderia sp. J8-2 TaxID=2805440 RepID=UPI002AB6B298|nr:hypothetical protein [Paraburkholderia sp. J8-2]